MSALHDAINDWNDDQIKWLIDHGADVNEADADGNTPLMLAVCKRLYTEHVHDLIAHGADIHAADRSGRTTLMLALDHGSLGGVGPLLEQYAALGETPTVDPAHEQGRLALLFAIYKNDVEAVHALLAAGADPNSRNKFGGTPLMMAVELGHAKVATALLEHGADVHARESDGNGWTALHLAAYTPQADCARILLEHGAEVDARDDGQWTPLMQAAWASSAATVRLLLEYGADIHAEDAEGGSALAQAGWLADEDTIRTLLDWGVPQPKHLRDAFYAAFTDNNHDKAPLFIKAGLKIGLPEAILLGDRPRILTSLREWADLEEINRALVTAAAHGSAEIVRLLLAHGADPNAGRGDRKALIVAHLNTGYAREIIGLLMQAGADVSVGNTDGETPFTLQTRWSDSPEGLLLMTKMLEHGADVNTQSEEGTTALMEAARLGETSVARFLLEHGAGVNLRDKEGRTALIHAVSQGHEDVVRLLLEHGATTNERGTHGRTALTLAQRWVGKTIAALLIDAGALE